MRQEGKPHACMDRVYDIDILGLICFSSCALLVCLIAAVLFTVVRDGGTAAATVLRAGDAKPGVGSRRRRDLCRSPGESQPRGCRPAGPKSGGRAYGKLPYSHGESFSFFSCGRSAITATILVHITPLARPMRDDQTNEEDRISRPCSVAAVRVSPCCLSVCLCACRTATSSCQTISDASPLLPQQPGLLFVLLML